MNVGGHPFEEFVGALVLVVDVEARGGGILACEWLLLDLGSGGAVEVDDDVQPRVFRPLAYTSQVRETSLREALAIPIHDVLPNPVSDRDSDGVEAEGGYILDVRLCVVGIVVVLECGVAGGLAEADHAVEFGHGAAAAHGVPFVVHHPWFGDEEAAEVDASHFVDIGEPSMGSAGEESEREAHEGEELHLG